MGFVLVELKMPLGRRAYVKGIVLLMVLGFFGDRKDQPEEGVSLVRWGNTIISWDLIRFELSVTTTGASSVTSIFFCGEQTVFCTYMKLYFVVEGQTVNTS